MPPEVTLRGSKKAKNYDPIKWDIFSSAILFSWMWSGKYPFEDEEDIVVWDIIGYINEGRRPELLGMPVQLKSLVERMWAQNPEDRPTMEEVNTELLEFNERKDKWTDNSGSFFSEIEHLHLCLKAGLSISGVNAEETSRTANVSSSSSIGQNTRLSFTNPVQDQRNFEVDIDSDASYNFMTSNDRQSYTSNGSMLNSLSKSFTSLSMISSFPGSKGFNQNPTEGNLIEEDTFTDLRSTLDPITSSQGKKKKKKKVHF